MRLGRKAGAEVAIDLGTSNTRVVVRGKGLVEEIPSAVAFQEGPRGRKVIGVGVTARKMMGRTPAGSRVVRPIRSGIIADFEGAEVLMGAALKAAGAGKLFKPAVLIGVPCDSSEAERRAFYDCARGAGAGTVTFTSTIMASALGAGLPVLAPEGHLVAEIGGGRTEVAVTSLGGLVVFRSVRLGGDDLDEAIGAMLAESHGVLVGESTRESLKIRLGSAVGESSGAMRVRGRDKSQQSAREVDVEADEVASAIGTRLGEMAQAVVEVLREAPPELASDILDRGLVLGGGTARIRDIEGLLREATQLAVLPCDEPERCVARGLLKIIEDSELSERVCSES